MKNVLLGLTLVVSAIATTVASAKPYTIKGQTYNPISKNAAAGFTQTGKASWYGGFFNGRKTASGKIYNVNELTAAHKTLPFGTKVRVTNTNTGKSVNVVITDRGPFVKGKIIDLTPRAFNAISHVKNGIANVKLEVIK